MANPLSQLENLAEQLVEGTFARILRTRLQPIEVARYIVRAMEDGQVISAQGQVVYPNVYVVYLHPDDLKALATYQEALQDELVRYIIGLARGVGATMPGRPRVYVRASRAVALRRVRVEASLMSARQKGANLGHTQEMPVRATPTEPATQTAYALFDGYRRMPVSEAVIAIGRGLDNDIILDDKRVSRQHAQLRRRYGQYVLYDLESTGGTTVNDQRVREAVLQAGDILSFAGIKVRFEEAGKADIESGSELPPGATRPLPRRPGTGANA